MIRKIIINKKFPQISLDINNELIHLFINRLMKDGKKTLAQKILKNVLIKLDSNEDKALLILENAIRNVRPRVFLKAKRVHGVSRQVPTGITFFKSINFAITWLIKFANKRNDKTIVLKLYKEILDANKSTGGAFRKKEEIHKMAIANKAFLTI